MHRRGHETRPIVLVMVLLLVVAGGCGDDGGPGGDGSTTTTGSGSTTTGSGSTTTGSGSTTTGSGSTTSSGSTTTKEKPQPKNIIAWILDLGIGAPPGPASEYFAAYEDLRQQRCSAARDRAVDVDGAELVAGAAAACLAAGNGDERLWDEAEAAADQQPATDNCLDAAVHGLLTRLLAAHRDHPDRTFQFSRTGGGGSPPCPRIDRIEPDRGAIGDEVRIVGDHLDLVTGVHVHGVSVEITRANGTLLIVIPDPGGPVDEADIVLVTEPADWEIDRATFRIVPSTDTSTDTSTGTQATETDTATTGSTTDG